MTNSELRLQTKFEKKTTQNAILKKQELAYREVIIHMNRFQGVYAKKKKQQQEFVLNLIECGRIILFLCVK